LKNTRLYGAEPQRVLSLCDLYAIFNLIIHPKVGEQLILHPLSSIALKWYLTSTNRLSPSGNIEETSIYGGYKHWTNQQHNFQPKNLATTNRPWSLRS